jgi:hypothetical protein
VIFGDPPHSESLIPGVVHAASNRNPIEQYP